MLIEQGEKGNPITFLRLFSFFRLVPEKRLNNGEERIEKQRNKEKDKEESNEGQENKKENEKLP